MTDDEIMSVLTERELKVDEGNLIDGPFIPDGTVRIYEGWSNVLGSGETLADAFSDLELRTS